MSGILFKWNVVYFSINIYKRRPPALNLKLNLKLNLNLAWPGRSEGLYNI